MLRSPGVDLAGPGCCCEGPRLSRPLCKALRLKAEGVRSRGGFLFATCRLRPAAEAEDEETWRSQGRVKQKQERMMSATCSVLVLLLLPMVVVVLEVVVVMVLVMRRALATVEVV